MIDHEVNLLIAKEVLKNIDIQKVVNAIDYKEIGKAVTEELAVALPESVLDAVYETDIVDKFAQEVTKKMVISFKGTK